jgi:hydrogenase nickel incorporation protein HypA/HybF
MHEASIAQSIVKTVLEQAEQQHANSVQSIDMEIGELSFLNPEQVEFWIKLGFKDTIAENAAIRFTEMKAVIHCKTCHYQGHLEVKEDPAYHLQLPQFKCPNCNQTDIQIIQGRETIIRSIKILRDENSTKK